MFSARAIAAISLGFSLLLPTGARAQDYPSRGITMIVPFPAGGGSDAVARLLANHLEQTWKKPVVVDNRPGGATVIGSIAVARAEPDGQTLLFTAPTLTTMKATMKAPPIDAEKGFEPISQIIFSPFMVAVNADLPVKSAEEFLKYARANPGKLNYGSVSVGAQLLTERFKKMSGIDMVHVPFRGSAPMETALAQGDIHFVLDAPITLNPVIDAGRARAIAVSTTQRSPMLPNLPSLAESGVPGYEASFWFGLLAPAGTSSDIVNKVAAQVSEFVKRPDISERLRGLGYIPLGNSPAEFRKLIETEVKQYDEIAREVGTEKQ